MYYEKFGILEMVGKLADVVILSILWLLCCIPVITIIPAGAALYYTVMKNLRRGRGNLGKVFWGSFRTNMKQGILLNVIVCIYGIVTLNWLAFAEQFKVTSAQGLIFHIISRAFLLFGIFSQVYLCPVLSRFRGNAKEVLMGAACMSYRHFVTSLCAVIMLAAVMYGVYVLPVSIVAAPAVYMLLLSLLVERNLKKYVECLNVKEADRWYLE